MTTTSCLPAPIPLHRPWLRRVADTFAERWLARRDRAARDVFVGEFETLDERTRRDIGLPDSIPRPEHGLSTAGLDRIRW